jgi:hypothetical protein
MPEIRSPIVGDWPEDGQVEEDFAISQALEPEPGA